MRSTHRLAVALVAFALLLAGCGGGDDTADSGAVQVVLSAGDQMKFDRKVIEVPAGSTVRLTLMHTGKMTVDAMGHNFVLLRPGTDLDAFARAAATAGETDYIPPRKKDEVIAHTTILGGGQSDTITFPAPEPGTYTFICSFPGHYMAMRGEFIVR